MDQRTQVVADFLRDTQSITDLCALYGVSRKTGYKWIDRYLRHGPAGLEEHSRRPRRSPNETSEEIVNAILEARRRHPHWGDKKLLALLAQAAPAVEAGRPVDGVRHLEAARPGADQTPTPAHRSSRETDDADRGAERRVER
jgi:transposase-like protein